MAWRDSINLFSLFIDKEVVLYNDKAKIILLAPTVRSLYEKANLSLVVNFMRREFADMEKLFKIWKPNSMFEILKLLMNEAGQYREFIGYKQGILEGLQNLFVDPVILDNLGNLWIGEVLLDEELYKYIVYVVRRLSGEKIEPPKVFKSKEEEEYFKMMEANEAKIRKIRQQSNRQEGQDVEMKMMLYIQYAFPQYTIDYLADQTFFQLIWLQQKAIKAINYEVEAKAYAAGNMKKKLKFFLEDK